MLRIIQSVLLSSAIVLLVIGATPAVGADMLYQTERPVVVQQRAAVVAPAYVEVRPVRCDEYYIEYRAPLYDPRVEIIRQCDRQIVRY